MLLIPVISEIVHFFLLSVPWPAVSVGSEHLTNSFHVSGLKIEEYPFMHSVFWASRSGRTYPLRVKPHKRKDRKREREWHIHGETGEWWKREKHVIIRYMQVFMGYVPICVNAYVYIGVRAYVCASPCSFISVWRGSIAVRLLILCSYMCRCMCRWIKCYAG